MKASILLSVLLLSFSSLAQVIPLVKGHAHNDYEHDQPLKEALNLGYTSIEIDIHLIGDELFVSHGRPLVPNKKRTLKVMYLDPLYEIITKNHGQVFPESDLPLTLLIDFKTKGDEIYWKLKDQLKEYKTLFKEPGSEMPLNIIVSGNVPFTTILEDHSRLVSIDGRPDDLGIGFHSDFMPLISEDFAKVCNWNGVGTIQPSELNKIQKLVDQVHRENKKVRFWNIPDQELVWNTLLVNGVDFINTDRLSDFQEFYMEKFNKIALEE